MSDYKSANSFMPSIKPANSVMPSIKPPNSFMPSVKTPNSIMSSIKPVNSTMPNVKKPANSVMPSVKPANSVVPSIKPANSIKPNIEPVNSAMYTEPRRRIPLPLHEPGMRYGGRTTRRMNASHIECSDVLVLFLREFCDRTNSRLMINELLEEFCDNLTDAKKKDEKNEGGSEDEFQLFVARKMAALKLGKQKLDPRFERKA